MAKQAGEQDLVAKKLRTGEIAVWDQEAKSIILLAAPGKEDTLTARLIRGATLKALVLQRGIKGSRLKATQDGG